MPGANCSLATCGTSRRTKGIGIFKLPAPVDDFHAEWRAKILSKITKDRVIDASFRNQIQKDKVHIFEKHFEEYEIETGKNKFDYLCFSQTCLLTKTDTRGKNYLADSIKAKNVRNHKFSNKN